MTSGHAVVVPLLAALACAPRLMRPDGRPCAVRFENTDIADAERRYERLGSLAVVKTGPEDRVREEARALAEREACRLGGDIVVVVVRRAAGPFGPRSAFQFHIFRRP